MKKDYDIAIIGAGLAGFASACAFAGEKTRTPLRICLIEARKKPDLSAFDKDPRASALTAASQNMLKSLGLWEKLAPFSQVIEKIHVAQGENEAATQPVLLNFHESNVDGTQSKGAVIIENKHLLRILYETVSHLKYVDIIFEQPVIHHVVKTNGVCLTLADQREISAKLVIAADGRNSPLRKAADIKTIGWSYNQSAIVANVHHEHPHEAIAHEHFLKAGPFAILPLTGNRSSLVWTETHKNATRILSGNDETFLFELTSRFGTQLGRLTPFGHRFAYPLSFQVASDFISQHIAFIGDAAHVVHPLAGLGFNLSLRDIAALCETVTDNVRLGMSAGDTSGLLRYQSWRRMDTLMVAMATDGLNRLFSNDNPTLKGLREFGLLSVEGMPALKTLITREAAGLTGDIPLLLQGKQI